MCGICGQALVDGRVDEQVINRMNRTLQHRGPDGSGIKTMGRIGLGHRRLSIIDLSGGAQPMSNEDGTVWISYNGEIYNHDELRARLIRAGHLYRSRSDTETVIHLYEEKGEQCVEDLRGMFAWSIWDQNAKKLILTRDRLGIKPLYYVHRQGDLIWGSEIKAILASGRVRPRLRIESLPEYLANGYVAGEHTLFQDIRRLAPGHQLTWQDGRVTIAPYWDIPESVENDLSEREAIEEFRRIFEESVRLRLMSDVPLGMFLSGGIDSSAISAVMSRLTSQPVKTFSVAFREREANELAYARVVASRFGTDHHEITVTPAEFFQKLPDLIWHEDEPIAFPSSVPLYFVSALAERHVKVVLTGEGSDELLAGYARYLKTIINLRLGGIYATLVPSLLRRQISAKIGRRCAGSKLHQKLSRSFLSLEPGIASMYYDNFSVFNRRRIENLLQPAWRTLSESHGPYAAQLAHFGSRGGPLLDRILYADMKTYLHELLMKQDQMSMAASIESRVPFLDHRLVEFASRLPVRLKLRGLTTKYILKASMRGILPEEILERSKMGFPVPLKTWFKNEMGEGLSECIAGERAFSRGLFDRDQVELLVREHRGGIFNHSERLWSLLNFELWNRIFIDGEEVSQIASIA